MTGLLLLALTVAVYLLAKRIYASSGKMYTSPLIITPLLVISFLLMTGIPYESYNAGGKWLSDLLQPATIAFAIPLHKNFKVLKKHAAEIAAGVLSGTVMAVLSSMLLAKWLHLSGALATSLVPRSVTTPIAMSISQSIGGVPSITAVFVILTGVLGTLMGPSVLRLFRIDNEIARGVSLGTAAHGTGTSKAFELSSLTGTISSIAMILTALFSIGLAPALLAVFLH
ncbi:CidB/LrgB family autolysis modulator [Paenibacillus helianthi]|uniref:CidB/LrgB family autolysis modulator n=1 Tax=Paenibacillus helianthi TaxID=1349432 RepID=A0ABX3ELG9_9BACL|nr:MULTISPECIES: CidB/LrgB family autolysis modulator [Paenibacillus]OKP78241.1 CidB/LrgB family autolysis modulator [Paenibacillus sp. P3E]OKP85407.1 CidB/LrgB family autolysis modulator [Paenibacillus helianthi]OKP85740.1 CidB/LrgB family autolysis modulator [Paenibacillus sp. P32E]